MFYSADNAKLLIDGKEILASTAQISLGANLSPNYSITQRHTNDYTAEGGVGGQLSFTYYLTGADYFKTFITGQGETGIERPTEDIYTNPISGNFGGGDLLHSRISMVDIFLLEFASFLLFS